MLLAALKLGFALILVYTPVLAVYRLYFHPLAKIPGPKLAALTDWYAKYFDVYLKCQFYHEVKRMHQKYGPIVRIGPNAVNVHDLEFYEEIMSPANRIRDRPENNRWLAMTPESGFSTISHALHRKRRASLNPFFSQRAITDLSDTIYEHIERLIHRLEQSHTSQTVIQAETAYTALTIDVITDYCFGESWNFLDHDDFNRTYREVVTQGFMNAVTLMRFPLIGQILYRTPDSVLTALDPRMAAMLKPISDMREKISVILSTQDGDVKGQRTIFSELLQSDLPTSEKTVSRVTDEAVVVVGAGGDTTAKTLVQLTFHLCNDQVVLEKLRSELRTAINQTKRPSLTDLRQLLYLTAVIYEGIRLFGSQAMVQTRICPTETLQYNGYRLPPGTEVSEIPCALLHDENLFPEPLKLIPERWIGLSAEEKHLRTALFFGTGARNCLGMNLAYAELYLTIAALFTKFDFELVDTEAENVRIKYYSVNGVADPKLGGLKFRVKNVLKG